MWRTEPVFWGTQAPRQLGARLIDAWIYEIAHNHPDPVTLGMAKSEVVQGNMTATVTGLIGGWIALAAALGLVVLGFFRLLSAFVQVSETQL